MDNYALDSHYGDEGEGEEYDDFNEGGSVGEYSGVDQHDSHGFGGFDNFKVKQSMVSKACSPEAKRWQRGREVPAFVECRFAQTSMQAEGCGKALDESDSNPCVQARARSHTHAHAYAHICTHTHIHTHMHTHPTYPNVHTHTWACVHVVIRVRPPLARELRGGLLRPYQCTIHVDPSGRIATISENLPAVLQVKLTSACIVRSVDNLENIASTTCMCWTCFGNLCPGWLQDVMAEW
eukprot:1161622-Pelagomonas_calceolata.AAC.22